MIVDGAVQRFDAPLSGLAVVGGALRGLIRKAPSDPVLPGRVLEREAVLEATAVDAYADVCGFAPEQGVPITWPHILAFPLQMRLLLGADFPYPAVGLVHLHNHIRQHARLGLGDRLTLRTRAGGFVAHDKGQAFTLKTTAVRDGETVWEGSSLYMRVGRPGSGEPAPVLAGDAANAQSETWRLSEDLGRRYARVSGDANPIHTSALGARLFGFRRAIAHGMWTKARAIAALSPPQPLTAAEVEVAFRAPLFLPGKAALYAASCGRERHFEVRD
ncbi:MAG TPA: protein dehydratase, partial [Brevundimonas sp.]|nr:protein dehydratase [Brevundimonas sp.]